MPQPNQPADIAIRTQGLSKKYLIYGQPRDRLLQIFNFSRRKYYSEFWALQDIDFSILMGETVGVIGRNGSGKSTLLQLICGTLTPTRGVIQVNGRIAPLLELGSGFNPEYTGLENIYLNGSILGMGAEEIEKKLDQILSFADIGDFVNRPVKTYSSGMFARLGFAVA
ncbi:MAG: ABC transporter ATP-binding protein, partial [Thermodesulfobacteriota bacterium]